MKKLYKVLIIVFVSIATLYAGSAFAAIAFDGNAVTNTSGASGSLSYSHTTSGSNRLLVVAVFNNISNTNPAPFVASVTYGGIALTRISTINTGTSSANEFWFLLNPPLGTNTIIVTGPAVLTYSYAASYTGVKQSGQPDAQNTGGSATGSLTVSVTTIADKTWIIGFANAPNGGLAVGASTTFRGGTAGFTQISDSNADETPPGTYSLAATATPDATWGLSILMASFAPATIFSPPGVSSLMSLAGDISLASTTLGSDFSITTLASTINFNWPSASVSTRGLLTSNDWSAFDSKQPSLGNLNGIVLGNGSGTYNATTTLGVGFGGTGANTLSGLLKGNGTGPVQTAIGGADYEFPITFNFPLSRSINAVSCLTASGSQAGCLSSSDWIIFNGKQNAIIPGAGLTFSGSILNSVWNSVGNNIYNNNPGSVGIGTTAPGSRLTVNGGDVFISTQSNGVILKATDGSNCFRVTVNNKGKLKTALITCP